MTASGRSARQGYEAGPHIGAPDFLYVLRVEERGEMSREVIVQILGVLIFVATIVVTVIAVTVQFSGDSLH
jgi:hypothetical protein